TRKIYLQKLLIFFAVRRRMKHGVDIIQNIYRRKGLKLPYCSERGGRRFGGRGGGSAKTPLLVRRGGSRFGGRGGGSAKTPLLVRRGGSRFGGRGGGSAKTPLLVRRGGSRFGLTGWWFC